MSYQGTGQFVLRDERGLWNDFTSNVYFFGLDNPSDMIPGYAKLGGKRKIIGRLDYDSDLGGLARLAREKPSILVGDKLYFPTLDESAFDIKGLNTSEQRRRLEILIENTDDPIRKNHLTEKLYEDPIPNRPVLGDVYRVFFRLSSGYSPFFLVIGSETVTDSRFADLKERRINLIDKKRSLQDQLKTGGNTSKPPMSYKDYVQHSQKLGLPDESIYTREKFENMFKPLSKKDLRSKISETKTQLDDIDQELDSVDFCFRQYENSEDYIKERIANTAHAKFLGETVSTVGTIFHSLSTFDFIPDKSTEIKFLPYKEEWIEEDRQRGEFY